MQCWPRQEILQEYCDLQPPEEISITAKKAGKNLS